MTPEDCHMNCTFDYRHCMPL